MASTTKGQKRRNSSDGTNSGVQPKNARNGGAHQQSGVVESDGEKDVSDDVSETLRQANSVLFDESVGNMDDSVMIEPASAEGARII